MIDAGDIKIIRRSAGPVSLGWMDAEDVAQDALVMAMERSDQLDNPASFATGVAARLGMRARRSMSSALRRGVTEEEREELPAEEAGEPSPMMQALAELDPASRELLMERYVDHVSIDDLAARAGISAKGMEGRIAKARMKLAALVGLPLVRTRVAPATTKRRVDLTGQRHGTLVVEGQAPRGRSTASANWWVRCLECGERSVRRTDYLRQPAPSCGASACRRKAKAMKTEAA